LPIYAEENLFSTWIYYKIENNFSLNANFPIKVTKIWDFWEWVSELNEQNWKMNNYRVCLDTENNLYVYCCDTYKVWEKPERCNNWTYKEEKTYFYKYVKIDEVKYSEWWQEKIVFPAFKVNSKVIWYSKWYKEFEITSVFTDFKRF
jgi:hypothetical protein